MKEGIKLIQSIPYENYLVEYGEGQNVFTGYITKKEDDGGYTLIKTRKNTNLKCLKIDVEYEVTKLLNEEAK